MQGYIININRVRDEDLIVTVLSKDALHTTYRFYGARHGTINLGFKIDFELQISPQSSIARLKDVMHIGFPWIYNHAKLRMWQQFNALLYKHLKQTQELDGFYFELLEYAAKIIDKQNPKRVIVEIYTKLLKLEGRLHTENICILCNDKIEGDIAYLRAFLPTHPSCSHRLHVRSKAMNELMLNNSSFFLSNKEIDILWSVIHEGL